MVQEEYCQQRFDESTYPQAQEAVRTRKKRKTGLVWLLRGDAAMHGYKDICGHRSQRLMSEEKWAACSDACQPWVAPPPGGWRHRLWLHHSEPFWDPPLLAGS